MAGYDPAESAGAAAEGKAADTDVTAPLTEPEDGTRLWYILGIMVPADPGAAAVVRWVP